MTDAEIEDILLAALGRHGTIEQAAAVTLWPDEHDQWIVRRREQDYKLLETMLAERRERAEAVKRYMAARG